MGRKVGVNDGLVLIGILLVWMVGMSFAGVGHDYGDALSKSILFFEGQRSGKLPPSQRMTWRKDSALQDGFQNGIVKNSIVRVKPVDLVGGYYDAGDNVKFNFPMAFTTTILAWSAIDFRPYLGSELQHTLEAIKWGTDYFLKCTSIPGFVFAQVGNGFADHNCWERPEDMDTPRTPYAVNKEFPGSEVSGEIAAALAASSIAMRSSNSTYAEILLTRAKDVFEFADTYQGSYNDSWACPFYCDFSGYQDELLWAAAWLYRATSLPYYSNYVLKNYYKLDPPYSHGSFAEFGWDTKHAGINVLVSQLGIAQHLRPNPFKVNADRFVCSVLPQSPTKSVSYSPGGLLFKQGGSNMQHSTALSFLLVVYGRYKIALKRNIHCGNVVANPTRLLQIARSQVDYILGDNPQNMSYMVGYGQKYPQRIHHRASTLPSTSAHPQKLRCQDGRSYFFSTKPNPNVLVGAVVGGPDINDKYPDSRADFPHSEPTTYINAPLVGLLSFYKGL